MDATVYAGDPNPLTLQTNVSRQRQERLTTQGWVFETDAGFMALGLDEQLQLTEAVKPKATLEKAGDALHLSNLHPHTDDGPAQPLIEQIRRYLSGERVTFDWPLNLSLLTPFQQEALRICATIPYGELRTYRWIAEEMNRPKAARPVGGAMGANPIALVIPCHRVVPSGFREGDDTLCLNWRYPLLQLEGIAL